MRILRKWASMNKQFSQAATGVSESDRRKWISARDGARVVTTCARARRTRVPRVSPRHAHPASPRSCVRRWHGRRLARHEPGLGVRVHRAKIRAEAHRRRASRPPPLRRGRVRHARRRHPPLCLRRARARQSWGPRGARARSRAACTSRASARSRTPGARAPPRMWSPGGGGGTTDAAPRPARCTPWRARWRSWRASAGTSSPARCWTSAAPAPRPCSWRTANRRRSRSCIPARTARRRARRVWKTRRLRTSNPVTPCVSAKGAVSTCPPSAT